MSGMTRLLGAALVAITLGAGASLPAASQEAAAQAPESERIGDWTLLCRGAAPERRCVMAQELGQAGAERSAAVLTVRLDGQGGVIGSVRTPQGVLLPVGVTAAVDGGEPVRFGYRTCVPGGCVAPFAITPEMTAALKAGSKLRVIFRDLRDRQFDSRFSLQGFTKAFARLQAEGRAG